MRLYHPPTTPFGRKVMLLPLEGRDLGSLSMGQIALAFLDFRPDEGNWRVGRPKLAAREGAMAEPASMRATTPPI